MINRRQFAQGFAATAAATSIAGCASTPPATTGPSGTDFRAGAGRNTSLGPIKQINAGDLSIGYAEFGPATGPAVLLLHGWPYDPSSYIDVGLTGEVESEATPTGSDIENALTWAQQHFRGKVPLLSFLGILQGIRRRAIIGTRILSVRVEEQLIQRV